MHKSDSSTSAVNDPENPDDEKNETPQYVSTTKRLPLI